MKSVAEPRGIGPAVAAGGALYWWRSRYVPDLRILERGTHAHPYRHHLHEPLKIAWLLSGHAAVTCRGRTWHLRAGDAFLAAPLEPHGGRAFEGTSVSYAALFIPPAILGDILRAAAAGAAPALPGLVVQPQALGLYERLLVQLRAAATHTAQIEAVAATLRAFLSSPAAALPAGHLLADRAVRRIRFLLDDAIGEPVRIRTIASAVNLHQRYVISLFSRALGIPPHQYLIARRVERARILIGTGRSLSGVAVDTGFTDQSHFTRMFRSTYGCTPRVYQQSACRSP